MSWREEFRRAYTTIRLRTWGVILEKNGTYIHVRLVGRVARVRTLECGPDAAGDIAAMCGVWEERGLEVKRG